MGVNLTELSKSVAKDLDLFPSEVRAVLAASFEKLTNDIASKKPVSISGFGSFRADKEGNIDFRPGRHLKNGLKH